MTWREMLPDGTIPLHADLTEQPHYTPLVVNGVTHSHPTLENPSRFVAILYHFDLKSISVP